MALPDGAQLAEVLEGVVHAWGNETPRSQLTARHFLGISDLGECREYARLMLDETEFTEDPDNWAAFVGTWVDAGVQQAIAKYHPHAKLGREVKLALPSGHVFTGHPDVVFPNGVLDIKTTDGLTQAIKSGPSLQQQFQRHGYAAALVQAGELSEDCWVGNAWFDRSGRTPKPHVDIEQYDPAWVERIDEWLSDVTYAHRNGEEAMKDKPLEWCQVCCPFFTACRGVDAMKDRDTQGLIDDPITLSTIDALLDAKERKKKAEKEIEDCRRALVNVSGTTSTHILRWVHVAESEVPGFSRAAFDKMDIRPIPKAKR